MDTEDSYKPLSSGPIYNIMIDTTFLFDQYSNRGIGRYGKEILKRLLKIVTLDPEWKVSILGFYDIERNLSAIELSPLAIEEILSEIEFYSLGEPVKSSIQNINFWKEKYKPIINTVRPNVFYAVHFERGLPSVAEFRELLDFYPKTVIMVHDAIPLVNNKFSSKSFIHNFFKKRFFLRMWDGVKNADLILTNSNFSRNDISKFGDVKEYKIRTIYLGVDESFDRNNSDFNVSETLNTLNKFNLKEGEYFFYDSGVEPNKCTNYLLEVFQNLLKDESMPKKLVVTGGSFLQGSGATIRAADILGRSFLKKAKELGVLDNIEATGRITFDEIKILLFSSKAHLNFSCYEGFNFPTIQAMRAKVPAVAVNSSCNPEVCLGGAFLVDTLDVSETAKRISKFLEGGDSLKIHLENAYEISLRYNWNQTVEETWKEIKSIA